MSMKFGTQKILWALLVAVAAAVVGCGGSSAGNVVTVSVSPSVATVIVTQSLTLTATVSGSTNTNVTWTCNYATTSFDSTGNPKTGTATPCNAQSGNIPSGSTASTVVFSAPQTVPDPTKITGNNCSGTAQTCALTITITATSAADTKKTGTSSITLDSGISVTLTPLTATVPTSASATAPSQFQFTASLTNDIGTTKGVTWLITQGTINLAKGINFPQLPTCSPACGSIDQNGLYSAPTTVPTTATLTIVATSKGDTTRFAIGTITIITGGPITFNGISPTIVPQGVAFYDLYIFAPGVTSASQVTVTADGGTVQSFNFASGQLKVLFPIPTTKVTSPPSTGVRLRLLPQNIANVDTYTVSVSDPSQPVTKVGSGPFKFSVVPVRATTVASSPDSIVQNALSNEVALIVNGGYFGPGGSFVTSTFQGNTLGVDPNFSTSRQLDLTFPGSTAGGAQPGLYQLTVGRTQNPAPPQNNPAVTNLAFFPDYQTIFPAAVTPAISQGVDGAALTQASAIDIDQELGIAAVAVTGQNRVDFFKIARASDGTPSLTPIGFTAAVNIPTSVSINHNLHQVAAVSFKDQKVLVFPIPTTSSATAIPAINTISLAGYIPAEQTPQPFPYSVGVDSDTNHAVVAYSSSANPTTAKVGFLLDLNTGASDCITTPQQPMGTKSPCVSGQVTLNTGLYPQITMIPHQHTGFVTPGGQGIANAINVLQSSTSIGIANVSLTSGLVTVTTSAAHGLNPGNPGTVLIEGVPKGTTNQVDFNGAFSVQSVINSTSFTYALTST
ncbi:MAG TPA: hypothetical protein VKT53_01025, partial [Candidatus Acidoferrum sp.]|nr:hypothetical protein [Candidatus Acidoferrum sp.]